MQEAGAVASGGRVGALGAQGLAPEDHQGVKRERKVGAQGAQRAGGVLGAALEPPLHRAEPPCTPAGAPVHRFVRVFETGNNSPNIMCASALALLIALATLQVDPAPAIRGVVLDATAMPVAGAVITILRNSGR